MKRAEKLIKEFQCPGCVCGISPTDCERYEYREMEGGSFRCEGHVCGTTMMPGGTIALGLPKGFCKTGFERDPFDKTGKTQRGRNKMDLRIWPAGKTPQWDRLNVPVWAMERDGFAFVRTFSPRVNLSFVDVIEGGKLPDGSINVGEFYEEID